MVKIFADLYQFLKNGNNIALTNRKVLHLKYIVGILYIW